MGVEGFGDLLRRHRQAAGMTQEGLAERSSLSVRGISDLERGLKQRPHSETVRLLAEALSLDGDDLAAFRASANPAVAMRPEPLPVPLTSLIGRDDEIRAIGGVLRPDTGVRLVTLTGPGGVGKTRLAIELATTARDAFRDGVAFAGLAGLGDASQVLPAVVTALGVRDGSNRPAAEQLDRYLHDRQVLLVLDNMEHVLDVVPALAELMERCPGLTVLATSRSPLSIEGERAYRIRPLSLPPARPSCVEAVAASPAARLFVQRAQLVDPGFSLSVSNADDVAAVCTRLDGLPLALVLAAARLNVLSIGELRTLLGRQLDVLTGGNRTLPPRHQTVRATIAWSHDLLSTEERETFRQFAVFAGGATLEAVAAVIGGGDRVHALDRLSALADRSLVYRMKTAGGTRFGMLETIREFALERLVASEEEEALRDRHAAWFLAYSENAEAELSGPDQAIWMKRLRDEDANLHAALSWLVDRADATSSQRMASALWRHWAAGGRLREARDWLDRALALGRGLGADAHAKALLRRGNIAIDLADYSAATSAFESSLAILRETGDDFGACGAMTGLGIAHLSQGEIDLARRSFETTLAICRARGWEHGISITLHNLARVAMAEDDFDEARQALEEAAVIVESQADTSAQAYLDFWLGRLDLYRGQIEAAQTRIESALSTFQEINDRLGLSLALLELGRIASSLQRYEEASDHLVAAMIELDEAGEVQSVIDCLEALALVDVAQRRQSRAVRLLAGADRWRELHQCPRLPLLDRVMRRELERYGIAPAPTGTDPIRHPDISALVKVASEHASE